MWMVEPKFMCRQHLLGEHKEIHQLVGSIKKGISIQGYVNKKIIEPLAIIHRHKALVDEMKDRGYNHNSPLDTKESAYAIAELTNEQLNCKVNKSKSMFDLFTRCKECKNNYEHQTKY